MKQITMAIPDSDNTKCQISISPDTTMTEAFQMLGTLASHILNAYYEASVRVLDGSENKSKDIKTASKGLKDSMYDALDTLISNVLYQFQPDHPRYTLEDEAIIELVNQKIEQQYNSLTPEQKTIYAQNYNKMRLQMSYRNFTAKRITDEDQSTDDQ